LREPDTVLDARNSGTTLRVLTGVCAAVPMGVVLTGDATLRRRPMLRVVSPLRRMGAVIDGRAQGRFPPLWVRGGGLRGTALRTEVASAQVKSALLLAGLGAEGETVVVEPRLSRDHTERMLGHAGVALARDGLAVRVPGGQAPLPRAWHVPGDTSSATFLAVAAVLADGSDLVVEDVGLNPTRTGALGALRRMGARLDLEPEAERSGEPAGSIRARASALRAIEIGPSEIPSLIDELPVLAVAATQADGTTVVRGADELRVKESDRIDAMVVGLTELGATVTARHDGMVIEGPTPLRGGEVDARGDHRIALAFAVASCAASGPVTIRGWECVDISFPGWESTLAAARGAAP
jgi:3-phosphoshikimate 1-carboxyvinyltransferase